ncbi:carbohydrate binding domain-containing protein [Coprobacter tertius]|uniref:Carbohydrate binding domain-containing protein n=1 Tax=Coprobacter tertius TaxID=2944915 RepID=A0ABT1MG49_9BACT|nr:carbohydrate binding domain-containing protein [Coprobacter tertius]MCP9611600.1 carbohydrate binding domain-containing protein [Coprobacter tertius]
MKAMKALFLFTLFFSLALHVESQNIIHNGGFEDTPSTYTILLHDAYFIPRVKGFFEKKTETSNPPIETNKTETGKWYKKASNTGYIIAEIQDKEKASGEYSLYLRNSPHMNQDNPKWYQCVLIQPVSLENDSQYRLTFKAKKENDPENHITKLTAVITDESSKINYTIFIKLKDNDEWNDYSVLFDLKNFKERQLSKKENENKTFDYRNGIIGISANPETSNHKTLLSSIFLDDISLEKIQ